LRTNSYSASKWARRSELFLFPGPSNPWRICGEYRSVEAIVRCSASECLCLPDVACGVRPVLVALDQPHVRNSHLAAGCPSYSSTDSAFVHYRPFIDIFTIQWASNSAHSTAYAAPLHSSYARFSASPDWESNQTATLATYRSDQLSFSSPVSTLSLCLHSTDPTSDMFRAHRGHSHDRHHDIPHPKQVYCGRTKGNRHVLLDVHAH